MVQLRHRQQNLGEVFFAREAESLMEAWMKEVASAIWWKGGECDWIGAHPSATAGAGARAVGGRCRFLLGGE
jgi:hypothetical protein